MSDVVMPRLGLDDAPMTIVAWLKKPGEHVVEGEPLLKVETDKATMQVEAPANGILAITHFNEGETVASGTTLARIAANEDELTDTVGLASESGDGTPPKSETPASDAPTHDTPGEIRGLRPSRADGPSPIHQSQPRPLHVLPEGDRRAQPLSGRRLAIIAQRLTAATAIPQFAIHRDISFPDTNTSAPAVGTLADAIVSAIAQAALAVPKVNALLVDGVVYQYATVNLAYAIDQPDGVIAPVIRGADALSLAELAMRRKDLVAAVLEHRLDQPELEAATITVSNVGSSQR